jgi:hypothetical protein
MIISVKNVPKRSHNTIYMLLDLFRSNFGEDFCIYIHKKYWSVIYFLAMIFTVLY